MGQALAIGIITNCGISKKDLENRETTIEEVIELMKSKLYFEPSIYDFEITEEYYLFKLKPSVMEMQLIPFLEKAYPLLYPERDLFYNSTIEDLKNSEPSTWQAYSDKKSAEEFQTDKYGESEYLYLNKPFAKPIRISSNSIMLSHEGKIIMEVYGRQFNFFKYCIQQTFSEFSIAKAIRVYITG